MNKYCRAAILKLMEAETDTNTSKIDEDTDVSRPSSGPYRSFLLRLFREEGEAPCWRVRLEPVAERGETVHFARLEGLLMYLSALE